ncbi:hypothetical protein EmuJ_000465900 [Echinococcus multilocularis]|uniref:Uncharacterized protein n=1 Tax=Echinococcus multilocularis TaxID=6211 RepID=A0A068Y5J5_ECHMU|nr:hypothetical protein EmuJ_000465900 [Echinococcus multilocularis]
MKDTVVWDFPKSPQTIYHIPICLYPYFISGSNICIQSFICEISVNFNFQSSPQKAFGNISNQGNEQISATVFTG